MSIGRIVASVLLFNAAWFVCVVYRMPWAIIAAAIVAGAHLFFFRPHRSEWRAVLVVALMGIAVDSALTFFEVFKFVETWNSGVDSMLVPPWIMALWVAFGSSINTSMRFFAQNRLLAVIAGMLAGPSAYFAGYSLGAVTFGYPLITTLLIVSVIWAVLFPLIVNVAGMVGEVDDPPVRATR